MWQAWTKSGRCTSPWCALMKGMGIATRRYLFWVEFAITLLIALAITVSIWLH